MPQIFIKYIPSEQAQWLRQYKTALYLLLSVVAERARWEDGESQDGLLPGDAILGESAWIQAGITRQQYRDAIEEGCSLGIWEVVWNPKNTKNQVRKGTIKRTIKSLVVNLKSSDVWDLNLNSGTIKRTKKEPSENHKQEPLEYKNLKEEQQQPLTPSSVVVVFDCLRHLGLSADDMRSLMAFPEERVQLAVEFSKIEPPKKSLTAQLIWHCKQPSPPLPAKLNKFNEQQLMADQFNERVKEIIPPEIYQKNKDAILDQRYFVWNGISYISISLKNLKRDIQADFDLALKLFNQEHVL